jgi:hypothetical protein
MVHGGNDVPGRQAIFELRQHRRNRDDVLFLFATYWSLGTRPWEEDATFVQREMGHACEWETSMMLKLAPQLVGDFRNAAPIETGSLFAPAARGWITRERTQPGHNRPAASCDSGKRRDALPCFRRRCGGADRARDHLGRQVVARLTNGAASSAVLEVDHLWATVAGLGDQLYGSADARQRGARITKEFHLTQAQYGNIEAVFAYAFAAGSIVFGWLADRFSVRWLYAGVLTTWSLAGLATGFVRNEQELLWCRMLLGFFEAGHWPCGIRTTRALLDARERSLGNGVLQSGTSVGAIITPLIMRGLMTSELGTWRIAFQVVGAAGLVWLVLWFALLRKADLPTPSRAPEMAPDGTAQSIWRILVSPPNAHHPLRHREHQHDLANSPRLASEDPQEGLGYSESDALYFTSAWYLATDIGCLGAGALAVWLGRRRLLRAQPRGLSSSQAAARSAPPARSRLCSRRAGCSSPCCSSREPARSASFRSITPSRRISPHGIKEKSLASRASPPG